MKRLGQLALIYVLISQGGQTIKATWTDNQPVRDLLDERCARGVCTYQLVSQADYDAVPNPSNAPDPVKQAEIRQAILDAKNTSKTSDERINALLKIILP